MADSYFEKLQLQAFRAGVQPRSAESQNWFRRKLKDVGTINRQSLLRDSALQRVARPRMGDMYMFFYDPKHKETLPYYDMFPLIIMVEKAPGGFYGLNMHYLPPVLRAKLFDGLAKSDERYDENTRFRARYRLLQSVRKLKYFKPCFKHYLTKHVEGRISKVEAPEWEIALFMPTQRFKKATATQVYADSRKAY